MCWSCLRPTRGRWLWNPLLTRFVRVENRLQHQRERLLGIDSFGAVPIKTDDSLGQDAVRYSPTNYFILRRIFNHLRLGNEDVFVDLGCGKGRVVLCAAQHPCRKVIGVELSPELAEIARQNARRANTMTLVEIFQADVAAYDMGEGTVFFMFNPFGATTMQFVMKNLEQSLLADPRQVRLVYYCSPQEDILDSLDWLEADDTARWPHIFRVWRNRAPGHPTESREPLDVDNQTDRNID